MAWLAEIMDTLKSSFPVCKGEGGGGGCSTKEQKNPCSIIPLECAKNEFIHTHMYTYVITILDFVLPLTMNFKQKNLQN